MLLLSGRGRPGLPGGIRPEASVSRTSCARQSPACCSPLSDLRIRRRFLHLAHTAHQAQTIGVLLLWVQVVVLSSSVISSTDSTGSSRSTAAAATGHRRTTSLHHLETRPKAAREPCAHVCARLYPGSSRWATDAPPACLQALFGLVGSVHRVTQLHGGH